LRTPASSPAGGAARARLQVVGGAEEVAGEFLDGVGARVVHLALGPALGVLGLRRIAQHLVLQALHLGAQGDDLVGGGVREFVDLFGRRLIVGHWSFL